MGLPQRNPLVLLMYDNSKIIKGFMYQHRAHGYGLESGYGDSSFKILMVDFFLICSLKQELKLY
jgi:hypothetical protein